MKGTTMKPRIGSFVLSAVLCLGFALLATCGGGGGSGQTSGGTGSIAVQLHVGDQQGVTVAQIICGQTPIVDVVAQVYDETNTLIASGGPWACEAHEGTISDVPAGCARTVVVLGRDEGSVNVYRGQVTICVVANQNNPADVVLTPFSAPTIVSPTGGTCFSGDSLMWDSPWAEFALQFALDNDGTFDFNNPDLSIGSVASEDTPRQYNLPANLLPDLTSYFWRAQAIDPFGNESAWSSPIIVGTPEALFFYSSSGC